MGGGRAPYSTKVGFEEFCVSICRVPGGFVVGSVGSSEVGIRYVCIGECMLGILAA